MFDFDFGECENPHRNENEMAGEKAGRIIRRLNDMKGLWHRLMSASAADAELTPMQAVLLIRIEEGQIKTVGNISETMPILQSNASALCKKLEGAGLLSRQRLEEDERVVALALTKEGERRTAIIKEKLNRIKNCVESLSEEELDGILKGFDLLSGLLSQMADGLEK